MSESVKEREDIISPDIHVNEECLKERLGMDVSFDVGIRKLPVFDREIQLYYVNGLVDTV